VCPLSLCVEHTFHLSIHLTRGTNAGENPPVSAVHHSLVKGPDRVRCQDNAGSSSGQSRLSVHIRISLQPGRLRQHYGMQNHCQVKGDSTTAVAREQLCGHVSPPATREHAIMEKIFSMRSVPGLYSKENRCKTRLCMRQIARRILLLENSSAVSAQWRPRVSAGISKLTKIGLRGSTSLAVVRLCLVLH
jgi:hypothetical protein